MPQGGTKVKIKDTFKNRFSTFLLWKKPRQIVGLTSVSLVTLTNGSWSEGHHDLYFTFQWFDLYLDLMYEHWDYKSVWPDVWPQNQCRSLWPIFHGPLILPDILKTIWYMKTKLGDYESVFFTLKINVGHCDLYFMVRCFCLLSWRLFDVWTSYFRIMSHYDQTFDLKINVCRCGLYFMVQWFCLISWRLFDVWTSHLGLWVSMTGHLTSK